MSVYPTVCLSQYASTWARVHIFIICKGHKNYFNMYIVLLGLIFMCKDIYLCFRDLCPRHCIHQLVYRTTREVRVTMCTCSIDWAGDVRTPWASHCCNKAWKIVFLKIIMHKLLVKTLFNNRTFITLINKANFYQCYFITQLIVS